METSSGGHYVDQRGRVVELISVLRSATHIYDCKLCVYGETHCYKQSPLVHGKHSHTACSDLLDEGASFESITEYFVEVNDDEKERT